MRMWLIAVLLLLTNVALATESTKMMTPLDRALVAGNKDPKERPNYWNTFLQAEIYIPTHNVPAKEEEKRSTIGEAIQPIVIESEGERYVMLFDTKERLSAWAKQEIGFVRLPGHAVVDMASLDARWALNVGTDYTKIFVPEEIAWLKQLLRESQVKATKIPSGTSVLVGAPANIPVGLLDTFRERLTKNKEVKEAYLGQVYFKLPGEKPHLALVLRVDQPSPPLIEAIQQDLGVVVRGSLGEGEYMDVLTEEDQTLAPVIIKAVKPFYVR
jgi:hypothetical protein